MDSIKKQIDLFNQTIEYSLKFSRRAKRLRLAIFSNGDLVVTQPRLMSQRTVEKFIKDKAEWIINKIIYFKNNKVSSPGPLDHLTRRDYLNNRERARKLITERAEYFSKLYNFKYNKINIRDQKTRWGSCSRRGDLNFNYKLIYLSPEVLDYVVVHEICHLKEFNHSLNFWNLVSREVQNYKELRKNLKNGQLI
ncbi:MAG: M48 family metallopeptidase [Patescibacteria group bacterium]